MNQLTSAVAASRAAAPQPVPAAVEEDGVVLKIATEPEELEGAFRLTYESYLQAGLTHPHPARCRVTAHQLLETSEVFLAVKNGVVVSTISLISDSVFGLPIDSAYREEVDEFRREGLHLAEVSCLADRREDVDQSMAMVLKVMRIMCQHAAIRRVDRFLIAVHPRHARYYKRLMGFRQMGEERQYSKVLDRPAIALYKDLDYPRAPNTKVFESFFQNPLPRQHLVRHHDRPRAFIERMWPLAVDHVPVPRKPVEREE